MKPKKFRIGIPAWATGEHSFGITKAYAHFVSHFGQLIFLNPYAAVDEKLDLLIIPGGPDVDTSRYDQPPGLYTGKPCPYREHFDKYHLPEYVNMGTPIYGICRGMQSLAVFFGGSLHQHINHETNPYDERGKLVHRVDIEAPYRTILHRNSIAVNYNKRDFIQYQTNSLHHQAVDIDSLEGSPMKVIGTADGAYPRKVAELIAHEELPIVGEQAHPEETWHSFAMNAIRYLMSIKKSIIA